MRAERNGDMTMAETVKKIFTVIDTMATDTGSAAAGNKLRGAIADAPEHIRLFVRDYRKKA